MPATLKELMRHASIETTMTYYVQQSAKVTSSELWAIQGNNLGNSEGTRKGEEQKTPCFKHTPQDSNLQPSDS